MSKVSRAMQIHLYGVLLSKMTGQKLLSRLVFYSREDALEYAANARLSAANRGARVVRLIAKMRKDI